MSTTRTGAESAANEIAGRPWWAYGLLGLALMLGGLVILGNLAAATIISVIFFGATLLVIGVIQVVHAFWAASWGGFLLSLVVGLLYFIGGCVLLADPIAASFALTILFAAVLVASGIFRLVLARRYWHRWGWLLLLSGIISILAGAVIVSGWPVSGLWVIGLCVGVDFLVHGFWWMVYAGAVRAAKNT